MHQSKLQQSIHSNGKFFGKLIIRFEKYDYVLDIALFSSIFYFVGCDVNSAIFGVMSRRVGLETPATQFLGSFGSLN